MSKLSNKKIIERYKSAKSKRSIWESHWQEVQDHVCPRKSNIQRVQPGGDKRGTGLFESSAIQANESLANALHGMLTNPAVEFFELSTGDESLDARDDNRLWLQDSSRKMHSVMKLSNFHTEVHEFYLDLGSIGTASMSIEEHDEFVALFTSRPIQECYIREDSSGLVNEIYRCINWNARKIAEEFGEEALTAKLKRALQKDLDEEFEIIHCVMPNDQYGRKYGAGGYEYEGRYLLVEEEHTLEEEGYQEFPYTVSRWTKTSGEDYGRSPAMNALSDIKMVQEMMKTTIKGAQLTIGPPLIMPDDGILFPLKLVPHGLNYYRAGLTETKIEPLITNSRVDFGIEMVEFVVRKIREAFFVDQLQLPAKTPEMTREEVMVRKEDNMKFLGPMLGRQEFEFLRPTVGRLYGIMNRKNLFLPMPDSLKGRRMNIRYSSLIAKAQRSIDVQSITRTFGVLAPFFQMDPSIGDNFTLDTIARFVSKQNGLPQELLRTSKDIKEMRAQRDSEKNKVDAQVQAQHQAELAQKALPAVAKAKEAGVI